MHEAAARRSLGKHFDSCVSTTLVAPVRSKRVHPLHSRVAVLSPLDVGERVQVRVLTVPREIVPQVRRTWTGGAAANPCVVDRCTISPGPMGGLGAGSAVASMSRAVPCTRVNTGQPGLSSPPAPPFEALDLQDDFDTLECPPSPRGPLSIARPLGLAITLLIVNLVLSFHFGVSLDFVVSLHCVFTCVVLASLALALRGSLRARCSSLRGSLRDSLRSSVDALGTRHGIVFLIFYFHVVYPVYLSYLS